MSTLKSVNVIHPSSAVNNIVNDASGNVSVGNNLTVAGTLGVTGTTTLAATTATSLSVGGVAAVAVAPGTNGNVLTSNGTAWTSAAPSGGTTPSAVGQIPFSTNGSTYTPTPKIVQGTAVASTSGTSIDFTSIPSWVKRVTVMFNGVSTSGTSIPQVQIGSGSVTTSGSVSTATSASATPVAASGTSGFLLVGQGNAANLITGLMVISSVGSNLWVAALSGSAFTTVSLCGGGNVTLSGALDRVRITTVNGTDTFDAGSINIMYE
jgi:hypothetical protein